MKSICVCGEVHLPYQMRWYWPGEEHRELAVERYFDEEATCSNFKGMSEETIRTNRSFKESIDAGGKYTFNISGTFLDQCKWEPSVLQSFAELADTGNVEFTASPYYHSISSLYHDLSHFKEQVRKHEDAITRLFGARPKTFINSGLIHSERLPETIEKMGFECMISEGSENLIKDGNPSHVYYSRLPTLLRHISLSEDIEKRFSEKKWKSYPLKADKFASWVNDIEGDVITLYINYYSLVDHHKKEKTLSDFIRELPICLEKYGIDMITPCEAAARYKKIDLKELETQSTARYGMHNLMGDHAQNLYLHELNTIDQELGHIRDEPGFDTFERVYGYLQQTDILLEMKPGSVQTAYSKAVNNFSILSDFRRTIWERKK